MREKSKVGLDGHEYFCPGPAAELAPILSRARSLAVPGLQDLLRADDAWRAVPLAAWFDCSLAAYLLNPEDRNYSWERLRQSLNQDARQKPDTDRRPPPPAPNKPIVVISLRIWSTGCYRQTTESRRPCSPDHSS